MLLMSADKTVLAIQPVHVPFSIFTSMLCRVQYNMCVFTNILHTW